MEGHFIDIATEYAKSREVGGACFDTIRFAGTENGFEYYHYFDSRLLGMKLGTPLMVKIDKSEKPFPVLDVHEAIRAHNREIRLNRS